eukprot:TRINITY_DN4955_c0_g2_i1.p1 TRINITY_DN4955_c0_g2~~TRINITY_DN4955_c0_g2_i1.p1  ORF type:complete len:2188 (+),score=488.74 TRINITY_DN4955_c0_g2_i1:141-6704(+)
MHRRLFLCAAVPCAAAASLPDFLANGWRELLPDPTGAEGQRRRVGDHCSAAFDGALFVYGGTNPVDGSGGNPAVYIFHIATRQVTTVVPPPGAPQPASRYKCKMAADPSSGLIYMYGGKTKVPAEAAFTDFWEFDTAAHTWAELPSGGGNAPVEESMDGDLAVIGGHVVISGADDGVHGKTFRYSIAQRIWLPVIEDGATALNKPLLVAVGMKGYLIGGYDAAGSFAEKLLMIDIAEASPFWQQLPQSGAAPRDDGMKGGALSDGSVVVFNTAGQVHRLDVTTGRWELLTRACGDPVPRDDMTGAVVADLLIIMGGIWGGEELRGDLQAFSTTRRGSPLPCMAMGAAQWREIVADPVGSAEDLRLIDHCSAVLQDKLYVYGGATSTAGSGGDLRLKIYDIAARSLELMDPTSGAPWPPGRYKCKMGASTESGKLYLFGGKTKVPEQKEFTDFWEYDTAAQSWRELPSGGQNAPVAESMDGYLAIFGDQVVISGADDGVHGKTFRYSIAQGAWLSVVEDGATALNKPLLVAVGMKGYLIGGYDAAGSFAEKLLMLDLSLAQPFWQQLPQSGAAPRDDGMKGGALSDGSIVVMSTKGEVHQLDPTTGAWAVLTQACGAPEPRDDFVGGVVDDFLVIMGGAGGGAEYRGDVALFSPYDRGGGGHGVGCVTWLSGAPGRWQKLIDVNGTGVYDHCSAHLGHTLYVFGGQDASGSGGDRRLRAYDLDKKELSFFEPPADAPWPAGRYKCKMDADASSAMLYLFGGKTKVPEEAEFTDFWVFDTDSAQWAELPTGADSPPAVSMDGDLKVIAGQVIVAGADDGVHGKTFRYSIAQGEWLSPIEDGATARNKPLLVPVGDLGYLIGGYDSDGVITRSLLSMNISSTVPSWQPVAQGGAVPEDDALKGGATSDGQTIIVYSSKGLLYTLDLATHNWTVKSAGCSWIPTRDDFVGEMVGDVLVVMGGASESVEYLSDLHAYIPGEDLASCGPGESPWDDNTGEETIGVPLIGSLGWLSLRHQGYRVGRTPTGDWSPTGVCYATRRLFIVMSEAAWPLAVFPESLQPESGRQLDVAPGLWTDHSGLACDHSAGVYMLHRRAPDMSAQLAVTEFARRGETLTLVGTLPVRHSHSADALACNTRSQLCSWGLATLTHTGEQYLLLLPHRPIAHPNGTVWALRRGAGVWEVAAEMVIPRAMSDYTGLSVDAQGRVLITSLIDATVLVTELAADKLEFDPAVAVLFSFPRRRHCNINGVAWITDRSGAASTSADGGHSFATVSGNRAGSLQGSECISTEQSLFLWQIPADYRTVTREAALARMQTTPAPTDFSGSFTERMGSVQQPWVFLGAHPTAGRLDHAAAAVNGTMYVFGGQDGNRGYSDELLTLEIDSLTWGSAARTLGALWPGARRSAVMLGDEQRRFLYLLGGVGTEGAARVVLYDFWRYDTHSGAWAPLPDYKTGERYAPGPAQGTSFRAASTARYIVLIGSFEGSENTWMVYDKVEDSWLAPFADPRLAVESPAIAAVGPEMVVAVGGIRTSQGVQSPQRTLLLRTDGPPDDWAWELLELAAGSPSGDRHSLFSIGQGAAVLLGDPRGKSALSSVGGAAFLDGSLSLWSVVNRTEAWLQPRSGFTGVTHRGRVVVFGGAKTGGQAASGELWGYDPRRCPLDCSGRGTCTMGNCMDCRGSSGVACEVLEPEGTDYTPVIAGASAAVGVLVVVFGVVIWHFTGETRRYRALYDTARVAESMAAQIEAMDLEGLNYLREIERPTATQRAFLSIVDSLLFYRSYMPQAVLQGGADPEEGAENSSHVQHGSVSEPGDNPLDTTSRSVSIILRSPSAHSPRGPPQRRASGISSGGSGTTPTHGLGGRGTVPELTLRQVSVLACNVRQLHRKGKGSVTLRETMNRYVAACTAPLLAAKGNVDGLSGDRLRCSWGAVRLVGGHRALAADASVRLRDSVTGVHVTLAAASANATVGHVGSTAMRFHTIIGPVVPFANVMERFACAKHAPDESIALLDSRIQADSPTVDCRWYARVAYAKLSDAPVLLWEIIGEAQQAAEGEEWMYSLAAAEARALYRAYNEASQAAVNSEIANAIGILKDVPQDAVQYAKCAELLQQLQSHQSGGPSPVAVLHLSDVVVGGQDRSPRESNIAGNCDVMDVSTGPRPAPTSCWTSDEASESDQGGAAPPPEHGDVTAREEIS